MVANPNGSGTSTLFRSFGQKWVAQDQPLAGSAPGGPVGDTFGRSMAVDDQTMVVGVPGKRGPTRGGVCVYPALGAVGAKRQTKRPPVGEQNDRFGTAVALSGDSILVSAPNDTENGPQRGAVYVFERTALQGSMNLGTMGPPKPTLPPTPGPINSH